MARTRDQSLHTEEAEVEFNFIELIRRIWLNREKDEKFVGIWYNLHVYHDINLTVQKLKEHQLFFPAFKVFTIFYHNKR